MAAPRSRNGKDVSRQTLDAWNPFSPSDGVKKDCIAQISVSFATLAACDLAATE
jgi:hypothetical protein